MRMEMDSADTSDTSFEEDWLRENREAIVNYNLHILEHGVFSDGLRAF